METDKLLLDDLEVVPTDQQETEDDVNPKAESVSEAVLFNTDWTVETIFTQVQKGNINLDPQFQRREAWDDGRKSRLIESIICNFPIPNVVLAEDKRKKGRYIVIDGKQRLFSLVSFMKDELVLRGLLVRKDLNGDTYSNIKAKDVEITDSIDNQPIRTTIIRNWPDEDYLYAVFYRLNSGSLPLSSQELRKALHGGKLLDYIDEYIRASKAFATIFGTMPDRRMRDVELVLRYISYAQSYNDYAGNLKRFLDDAVIYYDKNWEQEKPGLDEHLSNLDVSMEVAYKVFGVDAFKKWNGEAYESRINRALFDVITRYFSQPDLSELLLSSHAEIVNKYKQVCLDDTFKEAIERTTKTPKAVKDRHVIWGKALAGIIGKQLDENNMRLI